jgi:flagellum-specific ATP synthase
LIQVGAYQMGSNPEIDQAIQLREAMENFLRQDMHIGVDEDITRRDLKSLMQL